MEGIEEVESEKERMILDGVCEQRFSGEEGVGGESNPRKKRGLFASLPQTAAGLEEYGAKTNGNGSGSSSSATPLRSALQKSKKPKRSVRFSDLNLEKGGSEEETMLEETQNGHSDHSEEEDAPSRKKQKKTKRLVKQNPYGVLPMGNYYIDCSSPNFVDARRVGLGPFACLPDMVLAQILNELDGVDLSRLAQVSKAFYVYTNDDDELWKFFVVAEFGGDFRFRNGTWQETYKASIVERRVREKLASSSAMQLSPEYQEKQVQVEVDRLVPKHIPIRVRGFYSDLLHHAWSCRSAWLEQWVAPDTIERRSALTMTREEFERDFLIPNRPVIITDLVTKWPCFDRSNPNHWSRENLLRRYSDVIFKINQGVEMKLKDYLLYCATTQEENPMYLFDNEYGEKCPEMLGEYWVPEPIADRDFFELLPAEIRPSYRWILFGPAISGATFHKDPNSTSAWNGLIYGAKKWIMYPPDVVPPGIYASDDGWEVTTPVSSIEWFHNFYEHKTKTNSGVKPIEAIQRPGELVFIPNGWWHSVLNLEESIAVTQNFVSRHNLYNVLDFLRRKKKKDLYNAFEDALEKKHPGLIAEVDAEATAASSSSESSKPTSLWEQLRTPSSTTSSSSSSSPSSSAAPTTFSFSFSF